MPGKEFSDGRVIEVKERSKDMELSWLKRQLRQPGYPSFEEAQSLLDAIDRVYEDAEEYEVMLLKGGQNIDPYEEMSQFVKNNAKMLANILIDIPSIGMQEVLDVMISSKGYESVLHELEEWRTLPKKVAIRDEEFLQDLGNHPF